MEEYQTRVTDRDGKIDLETFETYPSDLAAIRTAKRLCRVGETVSVWRGDVCIYNEERKAHLKLVWPVTSGKPVR